MEFRILGPLEVLSEGQPLNLGGQKQRALLLLLLLEANQVVTNDRAIDALWEPPPRTAQKALQVYVSQLRKVLGKERLQTRQRGYLLRIEPDELDLSRFERLQAEGNLQQALSLWRGPPLPEFSQERFAQPAIARLDELRLTCLEARIEADLSGGRHVALVSELEALVREYPLRERLRGQLMLALYRSGRQAEALDAYREGRRRLVEELGLEPGQTLKELESSILRRDAALDAPPSGDGEPLAPSPELPKEAPVGTVTMLFTDVEGSTALVERLQEAYGEVRAEHGRFLRATFADHGGHEIDTQGDAFFAVFRRARDAVAAGVAAQRALAAHPWPDGVDVRVRIGIHTDEPTLAPEGWYHGLGVVRASRICAAGHGGQVLISQTTRNLIDEQATGTELTLRDLGEHHLKGLTRPERLFQVVAPGLQESFPPLRTVGAGAVPLEGREQELAVAARAALERRPPLLSRRARWLTAAGAIALVASLSVLLVEILGGGSRHPIVLGQNVLGAIDASSGKIVGAAAVGDTPTSVAVGDGAVWVLNSGEGTVSRVDLVSRKVLRTFPVGSSPSGLAVGAGSLWVASSDFRLAQIDPDSGTLLRTLDLPQSPNPLARGANAASVASAGAAVWATGSGTAVRVAPSALRVLPGGLACCNGIAIGYGAVWVTDATGISRVDGETGAILSRIRLPFSGSRVAAGAGAVWAIDPTGNSVWAIDPRTDQVTRTITVGNNPQDVAVERGSVWVATAAGRVVRIDPTALRVVQTVPVEGTPAGIAVGGGQIWVSLD